MIKRNISDRAVGDKPAELARFINEEMRPLVREMRSQMNARAGNVPSGDTLWAYAIGTEETAFATTLTIKSGALVAGSRYRVFLAFQYEWLGVLTCRIRLCAGATSANGGAVLYSGSSGLVPAPGTFGGSVTLCIAGTESAKSGASVVTSVEGGSSPSTALHYLQFQEQPAALDTDEDNDLYVTIECNGATAGNSVTLIDAYMQEIHR